MSQATTRSHRLAAVSLLAIALLGVYGLIARPLLMKYAFYQSSIEELQDRLQRFKGMLAARQELQAQLLRVRQDSSIDAYYLKPQTPTLAATDLQQKAKAAVEASGGRLVSTQILPVAQEGTFARVGIKVQMTGDTVTLQKVIYALETSRPLLFISNLQARARPVRQRGRDNQVETSVELTVQFDLSGYLRGSPA